VLELWKVVRELATAKAFGKTNASLGWGRQRENGPVELKIVPFELLWLHQRHTSRHLPLHDGRIIAQPINFDKSRSTKDLARGPVKQEERRWQLVLLLLRAVAGHAKSGECVGSRHGAWRLRGQHQALQKLCAPVTGLSQNGYGVDVVVMVDDDV